MSDSFDPYYIWLGIPPKDQPANHYRLLGLQDLEENADVIDAAANRQTTYLHEMAAGPNRQESQQLLNEIAAARRCLLNPESKQAYDETIRAKQAAAEASQAAAVPVAKAVAPVAPVIDAGANSIGDVPSFDFTAPSPVESAVSINAGQTASIAEPNQIFPSASVEPVSIGVGDPEGSAAAGGKKAGSKQLVIAGCSIAAVAIAAFAFSGGEESKQKPRSTGTSTKLDGSGTATTNSTEVAAETSEDPTGTEEEAPKKKSKPSLFDQVEDPGSIFQVPPSFDGKKKKSKK
jgi:hypothetical protein